VFISFGSRRLCGLFLCEAQLAHSPAVTAGLLFGESGSEEL
jgi:hypothetical protein